MIHNFLKFYINQAVELLIKPSEYWDHPVLSMQVIQLVLGNKTCSLYLHRIVDNLRTKVRSRIENLHLFIPEEEDAYLRDLFLSGKEASLRRIQLNETSFPQTIVEKIMLLLGFLCAEKKKNVIYDASAHMEAIVLASLIWR
jgi:hypothetical protein